MEALVASFAAPSLAGATAVTTAGGALAGSGTAAFLSGAATTAGATAVGAAAPGLMTTFLSGLSTGDLISGAFTGFSALSDIQSGEFAAASQESQALFSDFEAKQEVLKGREEAVRISQAATETLESNLVATLASGITGEGSAKAAQEAIITQAGFETDITREGAAISAGARRTRAQQLRVEAGASRATGIGKAAGRVGQFALRRTRRG